MPGPTNTLNSTKAALLVIDVQQALFKQKTPLYQAEQLLENLNHLIDLWHSKQGLVIFVQHSNQRLLEKGTTDWELHSELHRFSTDPIIHKTRGNAFEGTDLEETLAGRNISDLVITGLVTHGCIRATCRGALQAGYNTILVEDGHSSYSQNPAELIAEWNQKLAAEGVRLMNTDQINLATP